MYIKFEFEFEFGFFMIYFLVLDYLSVSVLFVNTYIYMPYFEVTYFGDELFMTSYAK